MYSEDRLSKKGNKFAPQAFPTVIFSKTKEGDNLCFFHSVTKTI